MENYASAVSDFRNARERAALQGILGRLTGRSTELLSYEEVRQKLRASGVVSRTLRDIPLNAIVGSVNRYNDFTRTFLPKLDSDRDRWARVKAATDELMGLPPIEVYQIGDAYFIHDGHHRASVARQMGNDYVQAYVTEIRTKVPLSPDIEPDELIIKAEYVDFLLQTNLDEMRPEADLSATCAGQYQKLLEHIEVHRHYIGLEQQREIPYEEAVAHWYDNVYLPVVQVIRDQGIMRDFHGRTETDLYLWIGKHRADIEESLGWDITYDAAAIDLVDQESGRWSRIVSRIGKRVLDVVVPDEIGSGTNGGQLRRENQAADMDDHLFSNVLVAVSGEEVSWSALEQASEIVRRENGNLRGLYIVSDEELRNSPESQTVYDRFYWRLGELGLPGQFAIDVGPIARTICERARWADLVVVKLSHPPEDSPRSRWASGFRRIIKRCPRPVLAVPDVASTLSRPLLAYDGSPRSKEALYVAAYLSGRWEIPLMVASVMEDDIGTETLDEARQYLENHAVQAEFELIAGPVVESLLSLAEATDRDLMIMGGYSGIPVVEVVLGSTVDAMLGKSPTPLLICR